MKNRKFWQITGILILLGQCAYSQKTNYIATDSTVVMNIKLIEGTSRNNAQFILMKSKDVEIKYSPEELTEYGFKDGTVYKSKNISISGQNRKVFLERIEHGKITLYYYTEKGTKTYFLEKDSTVFVEIPRGGNFQEMIIENTSDFEWKANQVQLARYNKKSLSKLISMYNDGKNLPIPFPRYGIAISYNRISYTVPSVMTQLSGINFIPSSSLSFGIFADLPIEMSSFSINAGVNFSKYGFYGNSISSESDVDVVGNFTSANLPVLLRYTIPTLGWRPFINAGGVYLYHLKNKIKIYESNFEQDVIIIKEILHKSPTPEGKLGYSIGIGLQRNLNYKKIASLELRYNQLPRSENSFNMSQLEILVSFTL